MQTFFIMWKNHHFFNIVSMRDSINDWIASLRSQWQSGYSLFVYVSLGRVASCAYPRICSNCAVACFHILGFIAREQRDRGDPVNNKVARIRVRALLTGLLRCTRNDKRVRATRAHPRALFLPLCITIKIAQTGDFLFTQTQFFNQVFVFRNTVLFDVCQ